MNLVVNDTVKMEWDKAGWLQTAARKGKKPTFIMASQNYESTKYGTLSVCFTATTAFLFVDGRGTSEQDIWSAEDLIATLKDDMPGNFPYSLEQYAPIIASGEENCIDDALTEFGLEAYKGDIEKRMKDVAPFGYETDFKM